MLVLFVVVDPKATTELFLWIEDTFIHHGVTSSKESFDPSKVGTLQTAFCCAAAADPCFLVVVQYLVDVGCPWHSPGDDGISAVACDWLLAQAIASVYSPVLEGFIFTLLTSPRCPAP